MTRLYAAFVLFPLVLTACGGHSSGPATHAGLPDALTRVDVTPSGSGGGRVFDRPRVSADGRYVVFTSNATDLVSDVTIAVTHVYRKDRLTGEIELVSRAWGSAGTPVGNGASAQPSISSDGRFVAFTSTSTNFVSGSGNGRLQVFVADLQEPRSVLLISTDLSGTLGNGHSDQPDISADGRYVVFSSQATNLVAGDTNGVRDIFLWDRLSGPGVARISEGFGSTQPTADCVTPTINDHGNLIAFVTASALKPSDTNGVADVYVTMPAAGLTWLASGPPGVTPNGATGSAVISRDGGSVAFVSSASNLVPGDTDGVSDAFVWHLNDGSVTRVSLTDAGAQPTQDVLDVWPNHDASLIAFTTAAAMVASDTNGGIDVYVRDRTAGRSHLVSISADGRQNDESCFDPCLSGDGGTVVFLATGTVFPGSEHTTMHVFAAPYAPSSGG